MNSYTKLLSREHTLKAEGFQDMIFVLTGTQTQIIYVVAILKGLGMLLSSLSINCFEHHSPFLAL